MHFLGTQQIWTTAYHPIANSLVEHFHQQLKGAIKCLSDTSHWTKALPLILLGIYITFKQDCHCTAAELVYGTTLRLFALLGQANMHTGLKDRLTTECSLNSSLGRSNVATPK